MSKGILLVGNESSLFNTIKAEVAKRTDSFSLGMVRNRLAAEEKTVETTEGAEKDPKVITWNSASSIGVRTLVLAAENRIKKIDEAIIVCMPPSMFKPVQSITPREIEMMVDDNIRCWFLVVRELVQYFSHVGEGSLALIAPPEPMLDGKNKAPQPKSFQADLLGLSAAASFRHYAQAVVSSLTEEPYKTMGFTAPEAGGEEEFVSWLFKVLDEDSPKNAGRWHRPSKKGFFSR